MARKSLLTGWEVEWCTRIPTDEFGDSDYDSAEYRYADFKTEEGAIAHAKSILPLDQFGSARVTPFHTEPYSDGYPGGSREYDADPIYVEKGDE